MNGAHAWSQICLTHKLALRSISAASTCQRRSVTDQRTLASHSPQALAGSGLKGRKSLRVTRVASVLLDRSTMTFARCLAINAVQEQAQQMGHLESRVNDPWRTALLGFLFVSGGC